MTSRGGGVDFADIVRVCEALGPYCLIGGLAVNCYTEPVYTMEADLVAVASMLDTLQDAMVNDGFQVNAFPHSINA